MWDSILHLFSPSSSTIITDLLWDEIGNSTGIKHTRKDLRVRKVCLILQPWQVVLFAGQVEFLKSLMHFLVFTIPMITRTMEILIILWPEISYVISYVCVLVFAWNSELWRHERDVSKRSPLSVLGRDGNEQRSGGKWKRIYGSC